MASRYKIIGGARGLPVQPVTIEDIARFKYDREHSLYTTPIGMKYEDYLEGKKVLFVKRAVPWKGLKGAQFWEEAAKHGRLAEGLRKAQAISREAAGVTGVVIAPDGRILPAKAVKQMEIAAEVKAGKRTLTV